MPTRPRDPRLQCFGTQSVWGRNPRYSLYRGVQKSARPVGDATTVWRSCDRWSGISLGLLECGCELRSGVRHLLRRCVPPTVVPAMGGVTTVVDLDEFKAGAVRLVLDEGRSGNDSR